MIFICDDPVEGSNFFSKIYFEGFAKQFLSFSRYFKIQIRALYLISVFKFHIPSHAGYNFNDIESSRFQLPEHFLFFSQLISKDTEPSIFYFNEKIEWDDRYTYLER